jgi:uncharacterized protein (DUF2141 family)
MRTIPKITFCFLILTVFSSCKKKKQEEIQPSTQIVEDTTGSTNTFSKLVVNISGMQNSNGKVNFALYNSSSSFNDPTQTYREIFSNAQINSMTVTIDSLPPGDYAFGIFHDENQNNEIDKNWMGIPSEGFAFSNNAMGSFGPPSYTQAKFTIPEKSIITQDINLKFY